MHWDQEVAAYLRQLDLGFTTEQIGVVIGLLAEHRLDADRAGYNRGYSDGYLQGRGSLDPPPDVLTGEPRREGGSGGGI